MLEKYGSLEVGEAVRIAISRGKDGDIRFLEGILKNRDAKKPAASQGAEGISHLTLPPTLKIWQDHLEPMGRFGSTWYFKALSEVSATFVEEQFKRAGFQIKILSCWSATAADEDYAAAN
jgi:hypothetical protein